MAGWLGGSRRMAALEQRIAAIEDAVRGLVDRIEGMAAEAGARGDALRDLRDEQQVQGAEMARFDRRLQAIADKVDDPLQGLETEEALAGMRLAIARLERQLDLQREDAARAATGFLERLEGMRRGR